jgi:hypothetical protein
MVCSQVFSIIYPTEYVQKQHPGHSERKRYATNDNSSGYGQVPDGIRITKKIVQDKTRNQHNARRDCVAHVGSTPEKPGFFLEAQAAMRASLVHVIKLINSPKRVFVHIALTALRAFGLGEGLNQRN